MNAFFSKHHCSWNINNMLLYKPWEFLFLLLLISHLFHLDKLLLMFISWRTIRFFLPHSAYGPIMQPVLCGDQEILALVSIIPCVSPYTLISRSNAKQFTRFPRTVQQRTHILQRIRRHRDNCRAEMHSSSPNFIIILIHWNWINKPDPGLYRYPLWIHRRLCESLRFSLQSCTTCTCFPS